MNSKNAPDQDACNTPFGSPDCCPPMQRPSTHYIYSIRTYVPTCSGAMSQFTFVAVEAVLHMCMSEWVESRKLLLIVNRWCLPSSERWLLEIGEDEPRIPLKHIKDAQISVRPEASGESQRAHGPPRRREDHLPQPPRWQRPRRCCGLGYGRVWST